MKNDLHIPFSEKLKSIPEVFGIRLNEQPPYDILEADGAFEVRRYKKQLWALVTIHGASFDTFREIAFEKLASYIFGGNTLNIDMAMTSPVLQSQEEANTWTMAFVLPHQYNFGSAPTPMDPDIELQEVEGYEAATIRYSGNNTLDEIRKQTAQLKEWLALRPQIEVVGRFCVAQFDQPFAIPFAKRNEIQVKVDLENLYGNEGF